jgi:hypothetical protein
MTWIKLTHTSGVTYLNLDQVHRFEETSSTDITFYYADNSTTSSYSLSSSSELASLIAKLSSILKVINIDQLATQG